MSEILFKNSDIKIISEAVKCLISRTYPSAVIEENIERKYIKFSNANSDNSENYVI